MAVSEGVLLKLKNNGVEVENLTNVSLSVNRNVIDVTNKSSNYWRDILVGTRQATITADGFVDYGATEGFSELYADLTSQTVGSFEVSTDVSGDNNYTGSCYVTSMDKTGSLDEGETFTVTLEVTGAPTEGTEV